MKAWVIAVSLAFTSVGTFAQEASPSPRLDTMSSKSAAEVHAEVVAARNNRSLDGSGEATELHVDAASVKDRAEIREEAVAAQSNGQIAYGEAQLRSFN